MISARRLCHNGRRRCWAPADRRHAGRSRVCRPARSSRCCSQFRLQASQELLSRLRRTAGLLSRHAVLRALRRPAEKCLRAAGVLPRQPPRDQDRALLHRLHRPCDNHRINRHKVFADLAQRGKTSMGWFFGFKLHLVFNNDNEIVALKLTPGNDTTPVPALTRDLIGKLFGDKGYTSWPKTCCVSTLFTRVRRNMKSLPLSLQDKALLNARNMADNDQGVLIPQSVQASIRHQRLRSHHRGHHRLPDQPVQAQAQSSALLSARNNSLKTPYPGYSITLVCWRKWARARRRSARRSSARWTRDSDSIVATEND